MDRSIVIVGAGMAGLAAAIDCAVQGARVTLVEKDSSAGGKMREATVAGQSIDAGPTVLTMLPVFEALFGDSGASLHDSVKVTAADVLARHRWTGGTTLDLYADVDRTTEAIARFAGDADARGYRDFAAAGQVIHDALRHTFIEADKPANPLSLMTRAGLGGLAGFARLDPYRSFWSMVSSHMRDPRLRQLFGRYTTYCGSSPFQAPATLALIAHVERRGVWLVEGGMARLADAMLARARSRGVTVRLETAVDEICVAKGRASGVRLAGGEQLHADSVLLAADAAALGAALFGNAAASGTAPFARRDRSLSAFTVAAVGQVAGPALRHTIAFSDDCRPEFDALARGRVPCDPTVYLCAQDRMAKDAPPPGPDERFFLVLNAPADGDHHDWTQSEIERCTMQAFRRLAMSGLALSPSAPLSISTPSDFARRFPATGGALYGRASHGWMASFRRPGSKTAVPGLFLAGGSVHPGAGVPMAVLSGRTAARAMLADRASTWHFLKAATPGGTSTRSATTAATA